MILGIDHVVLAADDPDGAADALGERLGLSVGPGGRHDALGTFNRLVWLGDTFIELVGVFDRTLAGDTWFGRPVLDALDRGGGMVTWVVAVDDLDEALRWAPPDSGLIGPTEGQRRRPDGQVVRWRLARPESISATRPFLIEHDRTAAEWTPDDRTARAAESHPLGGRARLTGVDVRTPSPAGAAGWIRSRLAVNAEGAGRGAVRVRLGSQEVRFVAARPGPEVIVDLVADVPLRAARAQIGDAVVRLRGTPAASSDPSQPETAGGV